MRITKTICTPGMTGFFYDDQKAIIESAIADGENYKGEPLTPGFSAVRQAGECVSIMLVLEDGQVACGDCVAVQYSGAGGRDPLFKASEFIPVIKEHVFPWLYGRKITGFKELSQELEDIRVNGKKLHTAIRYGVSQAILDAVAKSQKKLMCEIVAEEYGTRVNLSQIAIFTQTGDLRYSNADKAILKGAQVLPNGLINNIDTKLGGNGELLLDYIKWLRNRIVELRTDESYMPTLQIDVYGLIGQIFGAENYDKMIAYFEKLVKASAPFKLRIEGPVYGATRDKHVELLSKLTKKIDECGLDIEIVADEWCNTLEDIKYFADNKAGHMLQIKTPDLGGLGNSIEAVLYCKEKGTKVYLGGSCNETDLSAKACIHIAMATNPNQILAKPGMGLDEGYMIAHNEMSRIIALLK